MSLADFNILDWFICILLLFCFGLGMIRSITGELLTLIVWVLSFIIAQLLHHQLTIMVKPYVPATDYLGMIALVVIFVFCLILGSFTARWISLSLPGSHISLRMLGALFGLIKAMMILVVLLRAGQYFDIQETAIYQKSQWMQLVPVEKLWFTRLIHQMMDSLLAIQPL